MSRIVTLTRTTNACISFAVENFVRQEHRRYPEQEGKNYTFLKKMESEITKGVKYGYRTYRVILELLLQLEMFFKNLFLQSLLILNFLHGKRGRE